MGIGVIAERLIPWDKTDLGNTEKLKEQNEKLLSSLKGSNSMLKNNEENFTLTKK